MKIELNKNDSKLVKDNEIYTLLDNTELNNLVVSKTILHPGQETTGHKHEGQEEVYFFIKGSGMMEINDNKFFVDEGDVVLIEDGMFHRVHAEEKGCYFVCVFDGKRNH